MDVVSPGSYIALRTPSDLHKLLEIQPNTYVCAGELAHSFQAND